MELINVLTNALSGLLGTVIGSVIALLGTVWSQRRADRDSRRALVMKYQVQEYLRILDTSLEVFDAFEEFGKALSGRQEPGPNSTEEEIEEAERRDKAGVEAMSRLYTELNALAQQSLHVSAIGSGEIRDVADDVSSSINDYMKNTLSQALEDGRFIAADHYSESERLRRTIHYLVEIIRSYLEIDTLFSDSSSRCGKE